MKLMAVKLTSYLC